MTVICTYDELRVIAPSDDTIRTRPDRVLSEGLIYAENRLGEHAEMDCGEGTYEGLCDGCKADIEFVREARAEYERREALKLYVDDPNEPTLEERLGPYGIEWELEQRERMEGRA